MTARAHPQQASHGAQPEVQLARDAMRELLPAIRGRAQQAESDKCVPAQTIAELRKSNFFKLLRPTCHGGYGQDYRELAALNIELAQACASTAWVAGQLASHQWVAALFEAQAQQELWGGNKDALIGAVFVPSAGAATVEGGYRLGGRWTFASGCDHADWSLLGAMMKTESGETEPALMLVPAADYSIDRCWNVSGLAATGSHTLVLNDVFVPRHRVIRLADAVAGSTPGARLYAGDARYSVPMLCNLPSCLASVAIGAAQGALQDYIAEMRARRTQAGGGNRMAELTTIQVRVAEASAALDAATEILLRDLDRRIATLRSGRELTIEDRLASRRGHAYSAALALRASETLNVSTGGHGLDLANPVQRAWRDVNAAVRHIGLNWDVVGTLFGQHQLGLTPKGQY